MCTSQTWPPHSTEDIELVKDMKCPLSTYLFHPVARFPFPTSFPKQITLLEMSLICCCFDYLIGYLDLSSHTPKKRSKMESHIEAGNLDFPLEIHQAPENWDCQCLFWRINMSGHLGLKPN